MGLIYSKPLSIEEVFSKFDNNGDGIISQQEYETAQSMDIFTIFRIKKDMTLLEFEFSNRDTYASYEKNATETYKKHEQDIQKMLK